MGGKVRDLLHVYRKELLEMFRDKRVRSNALFSPMIVMLSILFMLGFLFQSIGDKKNMRIHVVNGKNVYVEGMRKAELQIIDVKSAAEGEALIKDGKADLVLEFPPNVAPTDTQTIIKAHFDDKEDKAKIALSAVRQLFQKLGEAKVKQLVVEKGLPPEAAEPLKLEEIVVQVGRKESAGGLLLSMLPYIIVLYAFMGTMGSAGDIVAGEKERLSLETLLITPVKRIDILLGKLLALSTVSLSSSLSATMGVVIASVSPIPMFKTILQGGLGLGPFEFLVVLAVLLPMVAMMTSLMLAVSSYAKNIREAQTHLAIVSIFIVMPAMASQFIGFIGLGKSMVVNLVPVLNSANAIRAAMQGKIEFVPVLVTILVNLALAAIFLTIATRLFHREKILVRV